MTSQLTPEFTEALAALTAALSVRPPEDHSAVRRAWLDQLRHVRGHGLASSAEFAAVLDGPNT